MQNRQKKTIIFSSYDDINNPYYAGGGARAIYEVTKRLASEYTITVITGNYKGAKDQIVDKVTYKRIGPSFIGPKVGQLIFQLLLPYAMKKEQFDVWIESFTPPFSVSGLQRYTKKPVIGLAHMLSAEDMQRKYKLPFYILENHGLKTYNNFITITEKTKEKIKRHNKKAHFFTIPNGVAIPHPTKTIRSKNPFILYLGRIEVNQKGLDLLLEAFNSMKTKTKANLVIAGTGTKKELQQLQEIIEKSNLTNRVTLKGKVDGAEKAKLLNEATLIAIPSRFETFGNVILEAMAYGKPTIGFAIEGLQWVPTACMIKVKPFNTKALANGIAKMLTDNTMQKKMASAAKIQVKNYTWEKTAEAYKRAIESVI